VVGVEELIDEDDYYYVVSAFGRQVDGGGYSMMI